MPLTKFNRGFEAHEVDASMLTPSQPKGKLFLIAMKGCGGCEEMKATLAKDDVKQKLRERFGTDEYEVGYPEEAGQNTNGTVAGNLAFSLDKWSAPVLTLVEEKDGKPVKVCAIDDDLQERSCATYREMPPE